MLGNLKPLLASGAITPADQKDAAIMGLLSLGAQYGQRGQPRLTPAAPPIDVGKAMGVYQNALQGAIKRGQFAKALKVETALQTALANPQMLGGIPKSMQPFIRTVGQHNPAAALSMVGPVLAAQAKDRTPTSLREIQTISNTLQTLSPTDPRRPVLKARLNKITTNTPMFMHAPKDYFGEMGLKVWEKASDEAATAASKMFTLNEMASLLRTGVPTGSVQKMALPFRKILADFGVGDKNIAVQEAITSVGDELALGKHGPGMGPMTDPDFRIYQGIMPGMKNTPAGNALIMQRIKREYLGKQMYAKVLREQIQEKGFQNVDAGDAWREVARRLDADPDIGPMIPKFKTESDFRKVQSKYAGMVVMIGNNPLYVKPKQ